MATLTLTDGTEINAAHGGQPFEGDDPVVVLVHGAAMDRTVWQMQTRYLAHHGFRVAAIDLPGHGMTPGTPPETIEGYAAWLADVLANMNVGPVHLAGHSLGSFIALQVAADHPELVASLMMLGTASAMPVHPVLQTAADEGDSLAWELMSGWAFGRSSKVGSHPSPGGSMVGATQALLSRAEDGVLGNDLRASSGYEGALDAAPRVTAPVTLVLGDDDKMTPVRAAKDLIAAFSDPTVVVIPDCGHMMTIEAPDAVRRAMLVAFSD